MTEYIVDGAEPNSTTLHYRTPNGYEAEKWLVVREEIVRCKDCVHFTPDEEFYIDLGCLVVPGATSDTCDLWANTKCKTLPDGFCAWGERKVVD